MNRRGLEDDARRLAGTLEKHRRLVLAAFTLIYAAGAAIRAWSKPFWYDEIVTLITARMPNWTATLRAAAACDASPPLPHLATHFCIRWFGENEITARIPAMIGFWVFCLCLFFIVRRRAGMLYGLAALLLPAATGAGDYAVEARAYGLELGFCGLALLAWMRAAEGLRRKIALPLLALSMAGAFYCHFYALLMYLPLGLGELLRTVRKRRIDVGIWASLAAGGIPVLVKLATIRAVIHGFLHTWAIPTADRILGFWEVEGLHFLTVLAILLCLGALVKAFSAEDSGGEEPPPAILADHEWLACAVLMLVPFIAGLLAVLVTHSFTERYAIFAVAGFVLLVTALIAQLGAGRSLPAYLLVLALLFPFFLPILSSPGHLNPYEQESLVHASLERGPVVVPDGQLFLQLWYYAPERLKSRLWFPADTAAAVKYLGFDTIDDGLLILRPWAKLSVMEYRDFHPAGGEFVAYQNIFRPGWVKARAVEEGATVEVKGLNRLRELLLIHQTQAVHN